MRTLALVLLVLVTGLVAACGGDDDAGSSSNASAKDVLAGVKPISSATIDAILRVNLENAPAEVGDKVELTFGGPMRSNGEGKLPSLDWDIGFTSDFSNFKSHVVSTGSDVFINLGGADFAVGEQNVARLNQSSANSKGDGLAAVGLDPLAAVSGVKEAGASEVGGTKTTRYTGDIDVDRALDQVESFLRHLPAQSTSGQPVPQLELTPERREQVKSTFQEPRFEVDVAEDDTIRRLVLTTRFVTPEANRRQAGGITGGSIEYRVDYTGVGEDVKISPVEGARPIEEFTAAFERELAKSTK
jgi:hypothetical protein